MIDTRSDRVAVLQFGIPYGSLRIYPTGETYRASSLGSYSLWDGQIVTHTKIILTANLYISRMLESELVR